jgi:AcrR family transcriptional regulator
MVINQAVTTIPSRDRRRETIMAVAREVFFENGYAAASMSAIAARLGGSKGTLYNYFKNKEELFEAQVRDLCGHVSMHALESNFEGAPAEALTAFGVELLEHLYSERVVKLFRILVAEAQRSPELARIFYEVGPARGQQKLESYLEAAKEHGRLNVPDCALAADQFSSLCKGSAHVKFLLNLIPPLTGEEIRSHIAQAVETFMGIYEPK